ncbi:MULTISPECIES: ATPase, T2SS/T4P/T4SS family [Cysteiniphilum]|uniref:Dot/Icm secretion system ATPase DotB n=1 Tax=Cysteiniphilum litorale TaxID=2056700 RepID=A0A8J2Z2U5_9GAMM|nr:MULTISPECIES: ATPase, T2SS/T4P/T4SS family [Cysteiniphilum]GGF91556.1 Dot/Icm secretion system ATPase DotB [Cysteiniphilum litorale]
MVEISSDSFKKYINISSTYQEQADDMYQFNRDKNRGASWVFQNLPGTINRRIHLDDILEHCCAKGADDIFISSNLKVMARVAGRNIQITDRKISVSELENIIQIITKDPASINVFTRGENLWGAYAINEEEHGSKRLRYAIEGTVDGYDISFRQLMDKPVKLSDLGLEQDVWSKIRTLNDGFVIVSGATGSGKSTLITSMLRELAEDNDGNHNILTFEEPVEIRFDKLNFNTSRVKQSEIPFNLKTFDIAVKGAMRRSPTIIFVGEINDFATLKASLAAAQTGHLVFATVHAKSVRNIFSRMLYLCPNDLRSSYLNDLIESTHVLVNQKLLKIKNELKRIPSREYCLFNDKFRKSLSEVGDNIHKVSQNIGDHIDHSKSTHKDCILNLKRKGIYVYDDVE